MERNNKRLEQLLNSYLLETITNAERDELWDYLNNPVYELQIKGLIADSFDQQNVGLEIEENRQRELLHYIYAQEKPVGTKTTKRSLWPRLIAAASIVLVAMAGLYYYNSDKNTEQYAPYTNDIDPGKNGATLTLANGQKILINEVGAGNIASQSGVRISKTANGQIIYEITGSNSGNIEYNTLSTTRGEQTQVRLPDGSLVFLNAASSLKFPTSFAKLKERRVEISGEGYFEVTKDKSHPFIVKTGDQEVEVLGTRFNINSYSNEVSVRTTLLEGAVKVSAYSNNSILRPGEQSELLNGKLNIATVKAEDAIAWKNGLFVFEDQPLKSIMKQVERWYDVEIIYAGDVDKNELYWGSVSRYDKVSKVLAALELTKNIHFKIEGRRILVTR